MSAAIDKTIKEVAVRHGVVLSKDDPILILQTMNERLINETQQAQAAMLAQFREEIELISSQWKDDAKEKAEKVLNVALENSKEVMANLLQESTQESLALIKQSLNESTNKALLVSQQAKKISQFSLFLSVTLLISFLMILF